MAIDLPDFSAFAVGGDEPSLPDAPDFSSEASSVEMPAAPKMPSLAGNQQEFVASLMPEAVKTSQRTGIDPRIIVAQAALESGWGKSAPGNNFFGIKSHGEPGGQTVSTHEHVGGQRVPMQDSFRTYGSPAESVSGYADFILENPRYQPMMLGRGLDEQLSALGASGYATDPEYANKVGQIARSLGGDVPSPLPPGAIPEPDLDGDLVQQMFSVPEDQRQNFLNRYLHKVLGIPQDLRAPPGHVGPYGPDTSGQTPADVPPVRNPERLPDFSKFGVPVGEEDDAASEAPSFVESFARGIDQAQQMGYGGIEALGELTGLDSVTEFGRTGREAEGRELKAQKSKSKFADIEGVGSFTQWAKETIGEQIPIMAPSTAGGLAGAGIGMAVGGPLGATVGGLIGAFVPSFTLGVGEVQGAIKEKDPNAVAPGWAFAGGTAIAALDSILPGKIGSSLIRAFGKETAEEIAKRALTKEVKESAIKRTAKGAATGMAVEGVTEAVQEAIAEVFSAQGADKPVNWDQMGEQMLEAGAAGALLGGVMGGGTAAATKPKTETGDPAPQPDQPQPTDGQIDGQSGNQSVAQPAQSVTQPSPQDAAAILRAQGYSDEDIADMDPAERAAEAQQAREQGVVPQAAPIAPDQPSAEPISDLIAQAKDLRDKNTPRRAVWLPKASIDELSQDDKNRKAVLGAGYVVKDFDGQGGTLVAKNKATANAAIKARDEGQELQSIIGGLVGSGTGKPAGGSAVVQQVTPEGDVTRESLVTPEQVEQTVEDFQSEGSDVRVVTPEEALVRREELTGEASEEAPDFSSQGVELGSRAAPVAAETAEDVDAAGARVTEPTEAQAKAGNYKKGHVEFQGLKVSIETPKGGTRRGKDADGTPWEVPDMPAHYGYIKRTKGADGDQVDVYIGSNPASDRVYLVDQVNPETGVFDEHKAVLGADSLEEAGTIYSRAFSDGRGPDRVGAVTEMSLDEFKTWLAKGPQTKPAGNLDTPPKSEEQEAEQPRATGFTTAKGSTYTVNEDGTTVRDKAARNDPGHEGDSGVKPVSAKTVYVTDQDGQRFAPPSDVKWRVVEHANGTYSLATKNEDGRWGISPESRNIAVTTDPEVGKHPLELWKPGKINGLTAYAGMHLGNAITEIRTGDAKTEPSKESAAKPDKERPVYNGPELSDEEIDYIVDVWKFAREVNARSKPVSLTAYLISRGGLINDHGEVSHLTGGHRGRPGLINKNGQTLDDAALRAWEAGYFPQAERPSISEFLEALQDDLHNGDVVPPQDLEALDDIEAAARVEEELYDYGFTVDQFRSENTLRAYFGQKPQRKADEQGVEDSEAASEAEAEEPAKPAPSGRRDEVDDIPFDIDPADRVPNAEIEAPTPKPFNEHGHYKGQRVRVIDNFGKHRFYGEVYGPSTGGAILVQRDGEVDGAYARIDSPLRVIAMPDKVEPSGETIKISSGMRLRSQNGREMAPVPKIGADTERKTINALKRIDAWLASEALAEAEFLSDGHLATLMRGLDPKNMSPSDRDSANLVLFGDEMGPTQANVISEPSEDGKPKKKGKEKAQPGSLFYDGELPEGITLGDVKPSRPDDVHLGKYEAIATRERPWSVQSSFADTQEEAVRKVLRRLGVETDKPAVHTEASGQTSLVPEPTTKDKIRAAEKEKDEKGGNEPMDIGMFGPDRDQTDLVDQAKAPTSTEAWLKEREERIRSSKAEGNQHLDDLPRDVEGMRGVAFRNVHDPKERGVVRTVANTGDVVVNWADKYSADKNLVSEQIKDGKAMVWQSWLSPSDLKDYVVDQAKTPPKEEGGSSEALDTPEPETSPAPEASQEEEAKPTAEEGAAADEPEPWQLTQQEYVRQQEQRYIAKRGGSVPAKAVDDVGLHAAKQHERLVRSAVQDGKPVPPEVLADYQEIAAENAANGRIDTLRDRLIGEGFKTIVEARKFARELGLDGTDKQLDETIETAVVAAARDLIASGNKRGRDTHTIYDRLVMLYGNQPNLGVRTSTSVANQAYSTPVPLAYIASRLARVAKADVVYEPTAGNGALLIEAGPGNDEVYANELDPNRAAALEEQGFAVTTEDATKHKLPEQPDSVIMNPPFGAVREGGQSKQWAIDGWKTTQVDHAIALKGLEQMTDDGRAVLILGGVKAESIEERRKGYRGQAKREFYHRLYNAYNVVDHFTVDGDLYKKQGAGWPVDVIVIEGRGKSARPLPALEPPAILSSWDALKEKLPNERPEANQTVGDSKSPDRASVRGGRSSSGDGSGSSTAVRGGSERLPADQENKPADVRDGGDRGEPDSVRPDRERDSAKQPEVDRDGKRTDKLPDADRGRPRVKPEAKGGQIAYEPASRSGSLNALTPVNMADAARGAMQRIEQRKGKVDQFVAKELGYTEAELHKALSAEQIDSVAAAIYNIENGGGYIMGDQTGLGKGRQVAALLRYAIRQGKTPVLITEKPDLYGDMFRDMRDIGLQDMLGHEPRMFMTNTGVNIPLDEEALKWKEEYDAASEARKEIKATADEMVEEGRSAEEITKKTGLRRNKDGNWIYPEKLPTRRGNFLKSGTKERVQSDMRAIMNGKGDFDVVFTTYDQMNTVKGESTERRRFLEQVAPNALIVMDESHNAGGTGAKEERFTRQDAPENRAEFARRLSSLAWGVAFSSATYAKRPDVMDLYARTDMGKAVDDPADLPALIQHGGVPMQQVVATMLSDAGQYMRRERSFEGVEYAVEGMPVNMAAYEQFSDAVRAVFQFDLMLKDTRSEIMEDILDSMGGATVRDSGVGEAAARTTAFASVMHNIVNQMLLAIKTTATAERAIAAHKAGEKPVIGLASTMESFIKDFADVAGIEQGGDIDLDFGDVLKRYLSRTLRITIKDSDGKKSHKQIPVEDLPPELQRMYQDAADIIESGNYDGLPISPIDWIRQKIKDAGLRVAEVTGRSTMVDYSQSPPKFVARPKREIGPAGKRGSIAAFNRGALDVLILNRSGSTGVSMHASKDFKDQRRRRMIIAQAEGNIDTHLQMLGRVHRTGQVIPPAYSQVVAEIPAEARPAAVLMGKMASLNANTTGARGSVFMGDSADFMNEVGDQVVAQIMFDDTDYLTDLGDPLLEDPETGAPMAKDAAKRVTGRLTLLKPDRQAELLDRIQEAYKREIAELDALGENPLEAKTLDLQAKTIESTVIREGQGDSPFLSATNVEKVSVKAQGRAHAPADISEKVAEFLKTKRTGGDPAADLVDLEVKGRAWLEKEKNRVGDHARSWIDADVQTFSADTRSGVRDRHMDTLRRWIATMDVTYPGARVTIGLPIGDLDGVVMEVKRTGKAKNPVALGSWDVRIAVPDGAREFIFPMSKLFPPSETKSEDEKGATIKPTKSTHAQLATMFEDARKEGRETRFMVTGNILAGYEQVRGRGMIVNYTTESGELKTGVLTGRDFSMEKFMKARSVRFTKTEQVMKFLDKEPGAKVGSTDNYVTLMRDGGDWVIITPASRRTGGSYFTDPDVRKAIAPAEFVKRGIFMRAEMPRNAFEKAVSVIRKIGALFETVEAQDVAQEIVKGDRALGPMGSYDGIKADLRDGKAVEIPAQAAAALDVIRRNPRPKTSPVKELAVKSLEPSPFSDDELILTLTDLDGNEYFYTDKFESVFQTQAVFDHLADGTPVVVLYNLDVVGDLDQAIRGQRAHEWVHALRRLGKLGGRVGRPGSVWDRLVGHAELLGVMHRSMHEHLSLIGSPFASSVRDKEETLFETYYRKYSGRDDFREVMDQESVAHMAQLYAHGALSDNDIMPVKGLLDAIISGDLDDAPPQGIDPRTGRLAALTRDQIETATRLYRGEPPNAEGGLGHHYTRSLARAQGFAGPNGKVYYVDVPLSRTGELKRSRDRFNVIVPADLRATRKEFTGKRTAALHPSTLTDALGFYSKLDDVLATLLPSDSMTAGTLQQRGVKASEMKARGITDLLIEGAQKVGRLREVAAKNRVELLESVYAPEEIDPFSEAAADEGNKGLKWEAYTLDPANPTNRERVLHLPRSAELVALNQRINEITEQQDKLTREHGPLLRGASPEEKARYTELKDEFASTMKKVMALQRDEFQDSAHWSEPNVIAHERSALTEDESGRTVYLLEEVQSTWGQKVRDLGVRDDARIAELNKTVEPIDAAREGVVSILTKVVAPELADSYKREGPAFVAMAAEAAIDGTPGQQLSSEDRAELREHIETLNDGNQDWYTAHEEKARLVHVGIPGNPMVNTTDQWMTTAFRRIIKNAVDAGAEAIAITPGYINAERFNKAVLAPKIEVIPKDTGTWLVHPKGPKGTTLAELSVDADGIVTALTGEAVIGEVDGKKLREVVGKDLAERILKMKEPGVIDTSDLAIGGDGMKYAYDVMYPKMLGKLLSKLDKSLKPEKLALSSPGPMSTYKDRLGLEIEFTTFPITDKIRAAVSKGQPLFALGPPADRPIRTTEGGYILRLPFFEKWGDPRFDEADRARALARLKEIQQLDVRKAPWGDLVQARQDINEISAQLFYTSPSSTLENVAKYSDEVSFYTLEALRTDDTQRKSLFSSDSLSDDLVDFGQEGRAAVDHLMSARRRGVSDLMRWGYDKEPRRNVDPARVGDTMRSGFYFKSGRLLQDVPEPLFNQGGLAVINWLTQAGVKRSEIEHFQLFEKFGSREPTTREAFQTAIAERMFDFNRRTSWLNPEYSVNDYGETESGRAKVRAFRGPRIPGRGVYFERLMGFPKRFKSGKVFAPGMFVSPHWDDIMSGTWASWRGSVRQIPGWGKTVVGEEGQTDFMQGATRQTGATSRPRVSQEEYLRIKGQRDTYLSVGHEATRLINLVADGDWETSYAFRKDLSPGTDLDIDGWMDRLEDLRERAASPEGSEALQRLGALRIAYPDFFEPGAKKRYITTERSLTPETPLDDSYVRTMVRDLLMLAADRKADSIAISTSETTARIQNNERAAHFYDAQLKPALESELRRITGDGSITLDLVQLPKAEGAPKQRPYTVWAAKLTPAQRAKITENGQPILSAAPSVKIDKKQEVSLQREISEAINIVNRIAGPQVDIVFDETLPTDRFISPEQRAATEAAFGGPVTETVGGYYSRKTLSAQALVGLAFNDPVYDLRTTAGHEAYHHVEEALASPAELRLLNSETEMNRIRRMAAPELGLDEESLRAMQPWEVRAAAFQRYRREREEGAPTSGLHIGVRRFFDRLNRIFRNVFNALRGHGYGSFEDIFERARTGEMAERGAPYRAGQRTGTVDMSGEEVMANADGAPRDDDSFAAQFLMELAAHDEMFVYPKAPGRTSLAGILDVVFPVVQVAGDATRLDEYRETGADKRFLLRDANDNDIYVYQTDESVWLDVSELPEGGGGSGIYQVIAEYALNTGRTFIGDPAGLSDVALRRRTEQMLSSALKHGTTRHLAPHQRQLDGDASLGVPSLRWQIGDDLGNIKSLIEVSIGSLAHHVPEFQRAYFDFGTRTFRTGQGEPLTDEMLRSWRGHPRIRAAGAGSRTLKRGILLNTISRAESGERPGLLERLLRQHDQLVAALPRTFYSSIPTNPDVLANVVPTPSAMFRGRGPSMLRRRVDRILERVQPATDRLRVSLQDKALPIRRIAVERIERETGTNLPVNLDTYVAEALYHGRAGERLLDLEAKHVEPLVDALRKAEISATDLGDYLYARHAKERNAAIAEIDPDNESGSGMTDEEADAILDRVANSGKQDQYDEAANLIDTMLDDTRKALLQAGLIDRETYDDWRSKYQNYVPLRGFELGEEENPARARTGRGFDVRGPEALQALGRRSKADNPVAYVIMQAQQAIIRAEKNKVDKTLYRTIKAHPNDAIWKIYKGEYRRRINPETGLVETYWVPPAFTRNENVHGVKIGGKQYWMELKHPGLARAMRGVGSDLQGGIIGRSMMTISRAYASLLTSYNPEFVISNYFRDIETALVNVTDVADKPAGIRKKILAEAFSIKSIRGIMNALRGDAQSEYAQWFEEFRLAGGKISYMEFNDVERIKGRINSSLKAGKMRRAIRNAAELIEDMNTSVENGIRLSVYIALRKNGVTKDRAAFVARELTVNFNRKGELSPIINSLYLFFNASAQGTTRMAQALARSKAVRYAVGGIFAGGLALDLLNYLISGDDDDGEKRYDKIPAWIKERNIIIMNPFGDDYVMIPLAYGYNVPYLAGQQAMSLMRSAAGLGKGPTPIEAAASIASSAAEAFNPMGTAASFWQYISPTLLDPGVQILENKTWYGGPIYPTKFDKLEPWSENYFSSASWWAKDTAKILNQVSGGNQARPGFFDISPETIEHYVEFAGGGVGKFVVNAINTGDRVMTGDEWLPEKTPFVRRLYGKATTQSRRREFYEAWNEIDAARYEFVQLNKAGLQGEAKDARDRYLPEIKAYGSMKATSKQLRSFRKQREEIEASDLPRSVKSEKLEEIMKRENAIILKALGTYHRLVKAFSKSNGETK